MRIAYLADIDISEQSGVLFKHLMQTQRWKDEGHVVKLFCVPCKDNISATELPIDYGIFYTRSIHYIKGPVGIVLNKIFAVREIIQALQAFNADIVYLRGTTWYPGLERILRRFPTVIEFNTLLEDEIKLTFSKKMRQMHYFGKDKLYRNMKGLVGVTDEISEHYAVKYKKPSITIANGFDTLSVERRGAKRGSERPQVVFVGTPGYLWHGVDKFLLMAKLIPQADFHLVGPVLEDTGPENFFQHGYLSKQQLADLYPNMDIGVGSLALHRNNLNEACPLKVREYAAYGLPLILAYTDTDLSGQSFTLQIANNEDNVTEGIEAIKHFIFKFKGQKVATDKVKPLIDYSFKERKRLEFFKSMIK